MCVGEKLRTSDTVLGDMSIITPPLLLFPYSSRLTDYLLSQVVKEVKLSVGCQIIIIFYNLLPDKTLFFFHGKEMTSFWILVSVLNYHIFEKHLETKKTLRTKFMTTVIKNFSFEKGNLSMLRDID